MQHRILLALLCMSFSLATVCGQANQPNVVLFFVDDLGWTSLGFRNDTFKTPNIDQLRREGLSFERAYIPTPTCSPSRASLLTGREAARMQMYRHIPHQAVYGFTPEGRTEQAMHKWPKDPAQRDSRNWFPLEEVTYAEELKKYDYYNMFVGKWHLGHEPYHPIRQGFDAQYGVSNAGHPKSYFAPFFKEPNPLADAPKDSYLTDVLTDESVRFISGYDKEQPFCLSMWLYNVHSPFQGRKDWLAKYHEMGLTGRFAEFAAMVSSMDESVGRVRAALEEKGIADETVFIFLSDQGGYFSNAPLAGGKIGGNTLGDGGARVPFLMYYPGMTVAGSKSEVPVSSIDVLPTLLHLASGKEKAPKNVNGVSLLPLLKNGDLHQRKLFFFRSYEDQYAAIIEGEWKLIKYLTGVYRLFNLKEDVGETNNLIANEPRKARKLQKALAKWERKVIPPAR